MAYIYVIQNSVNNKMYAGSTNNHARRWAEHKKKLRKNKHPTAPLQAAWNKYGEAAFVFTIVCKCSEAMRVFYEELFIAHAVYNVKKIVDAVPTVAREKISAAKKGVPLTEAHKKALSEAKRGRPVSETKRAQLNAQWSALFKDKEWVSKRSLAIKERYKDPALREKMRQQALKRWNKNAV